MDPHVDIPASTATVTVRAIDCVDHLYLDPGGFFWKPEIQNFGGVKAPVFCFLVSNGSHHVLFDLGIRSDWENYSPGFLDVIEKSTSISGTKNISQILDEKGSQIGVSSKDVKAIVWSHHHFDHTGDPSTFPSTTELVVGPGFKDKFMPGYPVRKDAFVLESAFEGRNVREISFEQNLKVGRFRAFDYFGNGSFYLLDAPGHSLGHMCALARVTSNPDSFVFMGADSCHHAALFRPSQYLPLPESIDPSPIPRFTPVCPGSILLAIHPNKSPREPFLKLSELGHPQLHDATETVNKIQELDTCDNILIALCHDQSLKGHLPELPNSLNNWHSEGLKHKTRWLFCKDFEKCIALE